MQSEPIQSPDGLRAYALSLAAIADAKGLSALANQLRYAANICSSGSEFFYESLAALRRARTELRPHATREQMDRLDDVIGQLDAAARRVGDRA
jgi:hypothetical protein